MVKRNCNSQEILIKAYIVHATVLPGISAGRTPAKRAGGDSMLSVLRVTAPARGPAVGPVYRKQCKPW